MADSRAAGGLCDIGGRPVVPGRSAREVEHRPRSGERILQPVARDGVAADMGDAGVRPSLLRVTAEYPHITPSGAEQRDHAAPDPAGTSCHHDGVVHGRPPVSCHICRLRLVDRVTIERRRT